MASQGDAIPCTVFLPVELGDVATDPPPGELLFDYAPGWRMWISRVADRYLVRYAGHYDFVIDCDFTIVRTIESSVATPGFAEVLQYGAVLAVINSLRGRYCLHATTIEVSGRGAAIYGNSGQGKSTTAALMIAAGANLVADDVTVLRPRTPATVYPGLLELRLRQTAEDIAALVGGAKRRETVDHRIGLRPSVDPPTDGVDLAVGLFPIPTRGAEKVVLERMSPFEAITSLIPSARLVGWIDPAIQAREFEAVGELAETLPCYRMKVPWGPPFERALAVELFDRVVDLVG